MLTESSSDRYINRYTHKQMNGLIDINFTLCSALKIIPKHTHTHTNTHKMIDIIKEYTWLHYMWVELLQSQCKSVNLDLHCIPGEREYNML